MAPYWTIAALLLILLFLEHGQARVRVYCGVTERSICRKKSSCQKYDDTGDDECGYNKICCHRANSTSHSHFPTIEEFTK